MGDLADRWRQECWQILLATGADPDGDDPRHLNPGEALRAVEELREEIEARDASDRDKAREAESGYAQGYAASRREERRRFELLHDLLLAMESREAAAGPYGDEPPREDYAETMASLIAQARNVIGDPREMGADRDKPRDPFSSGVFVYAVDIGGEEVYLFAIRYRARTLAALRELDVAVCFDWRGFESFRARPYDRLTDDLPRGVEAAQDGSRVREGA